MPKLVVTTPDGADTALDAIAGSSLMQVIRDAGFDDLEALCGGGLSCATCHVHVDEADLERLPELSRDEDEMLECVEDRTPQSRLSCQIPFGDDLDGLHVVIVVED